MSRQRLTNSKWTAVHPGRREKHFIVVDLTHQRSENPLAVLEAVLTKDRVSVPVAHLQDRDKWLPGWRR